MSTIETSTYTFLDKENKKIESARSLKSLCLSLKANKLDDHRGNERDLHFESLMWALFDPHKPTDDPEILEWCKWLFASGDQPDEFLSKIAFYDDAIMCSSIWTNSVDLVAYRCYTCALHRYMALCSECFLSGNHEGHDFRMINITGGGTCDCGDSQMMNKNGFCFRHGANDQKDKLKAPDDLVVVAEYILPHMFRRLLMHFREKFEILSIQQIVASSGNLVNFLQANSNYGAAMKDTIYKVIMDKNIYQNLFFSGKTYIKDRDNVLLLSLRHYKTALESMKSICSKEDAEALDCPDLCMELIHETLMDELVFWLIRMEFPQKFVTFLLSLLPCENYKQSLFNSLALHYTRIAEILARPESATTLLACRLHPITTQIVPDVATNDFSSKHAFLRVIIASLYSMMKRCLIKSDLHIKDGNCHMVANCLDPIMQQMNYWLLVNNLHEIISNRNVTLKFVSDSTLLDLWCNMISIFQGMNVNVCQLIEYMEFESRSYEKAFTAETKICASTTFHLLQNLNDKCNYEIILVMLQRVASRIEKWFEDIRFQPPSCWEPPVLECCFHLPLHRLYASLLRQAMKLEMLIDIPSETFLKQLIMHPLMIQVTKSEMKCNFWILNEDSMREQDYKYSNSQSCCSYVDLDIYLLQFCATKVDPDWFIATILERFRIVDFLSFLPDKVTSELEMEMRMLEGALRLIATLITNTVNFDLNEEEGTKMEIATLLCQGDKTYSQIMEMLPSKCYYCTSPRNVDEILQELADYKAPQFTPGIGMSEGVYTPKNVVWEKHFDPLFLMLRSYHLKDYQTAMDRYTQYLNKINSSYNENSIWPPYCLNVRHNFAYKGLKQLLHCKTLHSVLFTILYKAVSDAYTVYSEDVLSLVIYLLELILMFSINENSTLKSAEIRRSVFNMQYSEWFPGNCIITNLCHKIECVLYIDPLELNREENSLVPADQPTVVDYDMQPLHHSVGNVEGCIYMEPNSNRATALIRSFFCCFATNYESMTTVPSDNERLAMSSLADCQSSILHENTVNNEPVTSLHFYQRLDIEEICEDSRTSSKTEILIRELCIINIEESILSLLIKLHNKLSPSTYMPIKEQQTKFNRVGDGAFFIKNVLNRTYIESELCRSTIDDLCREAIVRSTENSSESKENIKKAAKARQQRLLAQFRTKQKAAYGQLLQRELPSSFSIELASTVENEDTKNEQVYECVICNSSSKLSTDKPIGLIGLWQTTKILEKSYSYELELLETTDKPDNNEHLAFSLVSLNNSLDAGIYIRTCGHYVHCDCIDSYLQSILADSTQTASPELKVKSIGFYCPLCQQFSNCALPLIALDENKSAEHLQVMSSLDKESASFINNLLGTVRSNVSQFVFLCNLLRTNLEIYYMLAVENLLQKRFSCNSELVKLIRHYLAFLEPMDFSSETDWFLLTGVTMKGATLTTDNEVPLLCRDPINLLIRLTLTLIQKTYDAKLFSTLFETVFLLHILQICLRETKAVDGVVVKNFSMINEDVTAETVVQKRTIRSLWLFICRQFAMKINLRDVSSSDADNDLDLNWIETRILTKSLQYLRIGAILKQSLCSCTFPEGNNFWTDPLSLKNFISDSNEDTVILSYHAIDGVSAIERWVEHIRLACKNDFEEIIQMTFPSILWKTPRLVNLPQNFEVLFRKYRHTKCANCQKSSKEILMCLLCGRMVSYGKLCCNSSNFSEFTSHTIDCGAGSCVYMSLHSSLVLVVWNKRFCHWGSLYLDSHGEEDIELKRGKPLFLNADRLALLEKQWLSHTFDKLWNC